MQLRHPLRQLAEVLRVAGPGDDVLPLRVDEEIPRRLRRPGPLVAAEGDPGARGLTLVSEHHLLHVDSRTPLIGYPVQSPIGDRSLPPPGVEDGVDRLFELAARIGRELLTGLLGEDPLEGCGQIAQVLSVEAGVLVGPFSLPRLPQLRLKARARDPPHNVAEHLHESAPRVGGEPLVARPGGQPRSRALVEAEVQHGVEHPRHRDPGAGADRDQQRVLGVAEPLADPLLEPRQRLIHLFGESGRLLAAAHVGDTGLGRDREPGRDPLGTQEPRHLGDVGALAAEQLPHLPRALVEVEDPGGGGVVEVHRLWGGQCRPPSAAVLVALSKWRSSPRSIL